MSSQLDLQVYKKTEKFDLEIYQEIYCFHDLFLRGSATVSCFFSHNLIQSCNAIFLASLKNKSDV